MDTTRRNFLQRSAAGAIIYKLGGVAPTLKAATSANDQIGMGFIGVGIRGTYLLEVFKGIQGVKPIMAASAYDGHLTSAKELTDGTIETTRDYRAVLDRKDIDAVTIATPDHLHYRMTLDALAAGKHVYVEKPLTWSIQEGQDIIKAAEKSGKQLLVGSGAKTSTLTAKARELIKAGALGKVNMIQMANHRNNAEGAWLYAVPPDASPQTIDWARFIGPSPKRAFDPKVFFHWRCWWEYSGGVATDLFVHLITQMHEIMDVPAPKSVVSQGGIFRWKDDGRTVPDLLSSIFEYEAGFLVTMYVNLTNSKELNGTVIRGTDATMVIGRRGLTIYPEPVPRPAQQYGTGGWPKALRAQYYESLGYTADGKPKTPLPETKPAQEVTVEPGLQHHEWFIKCLRENLPSKENATEGHLAAAAAHLANQAYRKGRKMSFDYKTSKVTES